MSEQLAEGQLLDEEGEAGVGVICPECGKRYKNAKSLNSHLHEYHRDPASSSSYGRGSRGSTSRRRGSTSRRGGGTEMNRLRRELKKDVAALSLLPFMAKGTADRLADPRITQMIDDKAGGFADAWVAVAEQNDWVRANLSLLMGSGVWLNAAVQTVALGYVVSVFAGAMPMHPGAMMLLPEMAQFFPQQPPAATAGANGSAAASEATVGA